MTLLVIVALVVLYKLVRWYFGRRSERKQREAASRAAFDLDAAIVAQRRAIAMRPPPAPPATPSYSHIPRIAFDYDTQMEFGGSRYHTAYISPEQAQYLAESWGWDDCEPGVYVTDLKSGPEVIGASSQKRFFIPEDQLIKP
jgi:hypothetical protein